MKKAISLVIAAIMLMSVLAFSGIFSAYHYLGDVNADGEVDNKDVVALFRFVSNSERAVVEENCDVNADGSIDNKDVTVLFRSTSRGGGTSSGEDEWILEKYADNGIHYIYTIAEGTYKNKTKTDGVIFGVFMIGKNKDNYYFTVMMYLDSMEMDNQIKSQTGFGIPYSVRVQTSVGMVLESGGAIYSDRMFLTGSDVPVVMYELKNGKSLTFTIKPKTDSKTVYEFTINSSNYNALVSKVD